jgi:hypothetical protein
VQAADKLLYKISDLMPELKQISEDNLKKTFEELDIQNGSELLVSDNSLNKPITIRLQLGT